MTTIYQWNSWPYEVSIHCPSCGEHATFCCPKQVTKKQYNQGQRMSLIYTNNWQGKLSCLACGANKQITIEWPKEAYYQASIRNHVLWAWDREHAVNIRDYLQSIERKRLGKGFKYSASLFHIPEIFKLSKNRDRCVKALNKAIKQGVQA